MKCKIYVNDVHMLTVDNRDVDSMIEANKVKELIL